MSFSVSNIFSGKLFHLSVLEHPIHHLSVLLFFCFCFYLYLHFWLLPLTFSISASFALSLLIPVPSFDYHKMFLFITYYRKKALNNCPGVLYIIWLLSFNKSIEIFCLLADYFFSPAHACKLNIQRYVLQAKASEMDFFPHQFLTSKRREEFPDLFSLNFWQYCIVAINFWKCFTSRTKDQWR